MINELRIRNEFLLGKCANKKDSTYIKLAVIKRILVDEKCFFKMKLEEAYSILNDLGYNSIDSQNIYKILISSGKYGKIKID